MLFPMKQAYVIRDCFGKTKNASQRHCGKVIEHEITHHLIGIIRNSARRTFPADLLHSAHVDLPCRAFYLIHQKALERANRSSIDSRCRSHLAFYIE